MQVFKAGWAAAIRTIRSGEMKVEPSGTVVDGQMKVEPSGTVVDDEDYALKFWSGAVPSAATFPMTRTQGKHSDASGSLAPR